MLGVQLATRTANRLGDELFLRRCESVFSPFRQMPDVATADHLQSSLSPSLPSFTPPPSQSQPDLRPLFDIRTRSRHHRGQSCSLHHHPNWQQLECCVHMVHGRNDRSNNGGITARPQNSPSAQKQSFNISKLVLWRSSLYGHGIAAEECVWQGRDFG